MVVYYFVVFLQEQNNLSLNLTRTSLNLPNGKFSKKTYIFIFGLALRFWVLVMLDLREPH